MLNGCSLPALGINLPQSWKVKTRQGVTNPFSLWFWWAGGIYRTERKNTQRRRCRMRHQFPLSLKGSVSAALDFPQESETNSYQLETFLFYKSCDFFKYKFSSFFPNPFPGIAAFSAFPIFFLVFYRKQTVSSFQSTIPFHVSIEKNSFFPGHWWRHTPLIPVLGT